MTGPAGPALPVVEVATAQVERAAARWLARFTSHHTRRAYVADLTSWLSHCARADVDPTIAGPDDVEAWRHALESAGQQPRTVARRLASVASWHQFLLAEGLRTTAPEVPRPRQVDRPRGTVSRAVVDRLLAAAAADPAAVALIHLLTSADLPVSELLDCDVEDLGQHRGRAVLRSAGGRVELPAAAVRALRAHLRDRISGPLFRTGTGARMTQPTAWRLIRRVARQAELPDPAAVNPRNLRAACARSAPG